MRRPVSIPIAGHGRLSVLATDREHLMLLAAEHGLAVTWVPEQLARYAAFPTERKVVIPEPIDDITYAAGLHEIGHCVEPEAYTLDLPASKVPAPVLLAEEEAAWRWARATASHWTPEMEAEVERCLATYRRRVERPVTIFQATPK